MDWIVIVRRILMSRRRASLAALALLVAVAGVVNVVVSTWSRSSRGSATSLAAAAGSTVVQWHNLVVTDAESGTLSYTDPQTVYNRLSGTITWLPRVGQVVMPGEALYRVDGEPVLMMSGSVPAYRDLSSSDSAGADVEQLNRNLVALRFDPGGIVIDDAWQPGTTAGVDLLQDSLGEKATGRLPLGQVVFLPGDRLISTLDATVGSTGTGGGSPAAAAATDARTPMVARAEFVALTATTTTRDTSTTSDPKPSAPVAHARSTTLTKSTTRSGHEARGCAGSLTELTASLRAEVAQLKAATAALRAATASPPSAARTSAARRSPSTAAAKSSYGGGSATPILQTNSTRLVVTVDLSASSQGEAVIGERVRVELPAGKSVAARITAVSPVAETSSSGANNSGGGGGGTGASSTVPVTITLHGHHLGAGLDQATVSVNFTQAKAKHVLSVPVTALIATSGGAYAVQAANAPYALMPARTGLFAAGFVQISGTGIHAGLRVTDSQG